MGRIVPNGLPGDLQGSAGVRIRTGVQIPIPQWKIAAGDFQADRVTFQKDVAGDLEIHRVFQHRSGLD